MDEFAKKINDLPIPEKEFFLSLSPMLEMKKSFVVFNIDSSLSENIAKEIGYVYVGLLALKDLPEIIIKNVSLDKNVAYSIAYEINKRIFNRFPNFFKNSSELLEQWKQLKLTSSVSEEETKKKVFEFEPWILEEEKNIQIEKVSQQRKEDEVKRKISENLVKATLSEALKNYPELGEQLITSEKITLHSFPEPVRPSIKNWLADYTFTLGQDKRGAMERSRYLFQNINARNLKGEDRQRLSYILRVYDENLPVTINKTTRRVIFAAAVAEELAVSPPSAPKTQPSFSQSHDPGSVHFSSPQQLPYEQKNNPNVLNITRLEEKPKPVPKNLVNLKG